MSYLTLMPKVLYSAPLLGCPVFVDIRPVLHGDVIAMYHQRRVRGPLG